MLLCLVWFALFKYMLKIWSVFFLGWEKRNGVCDMLQFCRHPSDVRVQGPVNHFYWGLIYQSAGLLISV